MDSAIDTSKQGQWQELLAKVQDLAKATSDENAQLVHKVNELGLEVNAWKNQALSAMRGPTGKDSPSKREVTFSVPQKDLVLCVVDCTRCMFSTLYITEGQEGGRKAGEEVVRGIKDHLTAEDKSSQEGNIKLSINVYIMKSQLRNDLIASESCTAAQYDDFFVGLNETLCLNIVEVGSKIDAKKKIDEHLQLFAGLPQTTRVAFSGGNGIEYLSIMPTLDAFSAKSKLLILRSYNGPSNGVSSRLPSLVLPGLFTSIPTPTGSWAPTTPLAPPFPLAETDESEANTSPPRPLNGQRRPSVIDPSLPLYKQNPPPCNEYYLMYSCSKENRCKYSHEYPLTDEQLAQLSKSAKQSPCWYLNTDKECPNANCCWGHVCPFGIACYHLSRDKCRFKGSGMHRPQGASHTDSSSRSA